MDARDLSQFLVGRGRRLGASADVRGNRRRRRPLPSNQRKIGLLAVLLPRRKSPPHRRPGLLWGLVLCLIGACTGTRLYYIQGELPVLENDRNLMVVRGPWPNVPAVLSDATAVPDDLVLPMLKSLMTLPGAIDACDASGHPRADASEYCAAVYKTPHDWRVSWPIRRLVGEKNACKPPFGGVEDDDFGRGLPVFGYAHNHPCGLFCEQQGFADISCHKSTRRRLGDGRVRRHSRRTGSE